MHLKQFIASSLVLLFSLCSFNAHASNYIQPKIVGGSDATSPFSWMASIIVLDEGDEATEDDDVYYALCGATLIDKDWVLTAAHCLEDLEAENVTVFIGFRDFDNLRNEAFEAIDADELILHSDFINTESLVDNDIGLIKLKESSTLTPIDLATSSEYDALTENTLLTLLGWGATTFDVDDGPGNFADVLQVAEVPLRTQAQCELLYDGIDSDIVCAGLPEGGIDACFGDSGGPIVIEDDGRYIHIGLVSYGDGCAIPGNYGVYTKTSAYRSWISRKMNPSAPAGSSDGGSINWLFLLIAPLLVARSKFKH